MGKCVSKQPSAITLASAEYLAKNQQQQQQNNNNNNNNTNNSNKNINYSSGCSSSRSNSNRSIKSCDGYNDNDGGSTGDGNTKYSNSSFDYITISSTNRNKKLRKECNERRINDSNGSSSSSHSSSSANSSTLKEDQDDYANDSTIWCNLIEDSECHNNKNNVRDVVDGDDVDGIDVQIVKNNRNKKGQTESKKKSKIGAPETKGTAMSFGFRKKLHTTPSKKKNLLNRNKNNNKVQQQQQQQTLLDNDDGDFIEDIDDLQNDCHIYDEQYNSATVISNPGLVTTSDKNGNEGPRKKSTNKTETTTWATQTHHHEQHNNIPNIIKENVNAGAIGGPYKNRFGFRAANVVRPASTGITQQNFTDFQENVENNNYSSKRRSKSASASANSTRSAMTSANRNNNNNNNNNDPINQHHQPAHTQNQVRFDDVPKINHIPSVTSTEYYQWKQPERRPYGAELIAHKPPQYQRYQPQTSHTIINTGMHTNVIVKPQPKSVESSTTMGKFTLHTASLPKPQYPVPISLTNTQTTTVMDVKSAKQMANNNRKNFFGPREISADSGISSMDNNSSASTSSSAAARGSLMTTNSNQNNNNRNLNGNDRNKFNNKTRPRNLEMIINARHKFEVRDLDAISCESIEPLSLPMLPSAFSSNNQPVPLSGLVRTNTTLNRDPPNDNQEQNNERRKPVRAHSDIESIEETKLFRDRSTSEKDTNKNGNSSKNSSPGSSRASWCNAGESLALKDCSSISSSDDSKDNRNAKTFDNETTDVLSSITLNDKGGSLLSSLTDSMSITPVKPEKLSQNEVKPERPKLLTNIAETKFAEMAAAVSDVLLDDETSPTDSLVSSTEEAVDALLRKVKKKQIEDFHEKDIDEISPELEVCSPFSPGTPTHASNSLSLSDIGNNFLIDDEIADQPALLFDHDKNNDAESCQLGSSLTDTPTLMETCTAGVASNNNNNNNANKRSPKNLSKSRNLMQAAIELSLRTPISLRKATLLSKAESLDTLSPCESIASDDLMMDFESSSMDSIDRISQSIKSGNCSVIQNFDENELFAELEHKGTDMIREWNNILRVHRTGRESIISHLPARATRLLNRSRLQQQQQLNAGNNTGSDSPKSTDSFNRKLPSSRASSLHCSNRDTNSSSDDLLLHDKSFRNSMIQDVLYFKKQLMRLRRILQEEEECLLRTDTLNPFEVSNGKFFASSCSNTDGISDTTATNNNNNNNGLIQLTTTQHLVENSNEKNHFGSLQSLSDDPLVELADLRRQVVYLQGQVEDRDRTIRFQKNLIGKLESDKEKSTTVPANGTVCEKEVVNSATQTERVRPLSIGQEGLARSKPEYTSYTINHHQQPISSTTTTEITEQSPLNQSRRHTVISTTFTNLNQFSTATNSPRRASIALDKLQYKPVKTTAIGEVMSITSTPKSSTTTSAAKLDINLNGSNGTNGTNGNHHQNGVAIIKENHLKSPSIILNNGDKLNIQKLTVNGFNNKQNGDYSMDLKKLLTVKNGNSNGLNGNNNGQILNGNNSNSIKMEMLNDNKNSVKCNLRFNGNNNNKIQKNGFDITQKTINSTSTAASENISKLNSVTIV